MGSSSLVCSKQPPPHGGRLLETLLQALLQALLQTLLQTPPAHLCRRGQDRAEDPSGEATSPAAP